MTNESGLEPRGVAVLIQAYMPERKAALIALPDNVASQVAMVDLRATVIAVGPIAWQDEGVYERRWYSLWLLKHWKPIPRANVGDKVLVTKFAGIMALGLADGKQYRLINDRDVYCRITAEES